LEQTRELADLIQQAAPVRLEKPGPGVATPRQQRLRPVARVFQALRILVNRELANLTALLRVLPTVLGPGGRACIISFHSGEDRLVKQAFRDGLRSGVYSTVSEDAVRATWGERQDNPRARSAKLRWARRIG
jgi:16S rRNA (cytosine1402-N4)-methyltransferase